MYMLLLFCSNAVSAMVVVRSLRTIHERISSIYSVCSFLSLRIQSVSMRFFFWKYTAFRLRKTFLWYQAIYTLKCSEICFCSKQQDCRLDQTMTESHVSQQKQQQSSIIY